MQPSRPLSSLSPPALNLSQNESFPVSLFFASGGQSIGALASASVLLMNIQGWFPLGLTGLISLLSKGLLRVFSNTTIRKHQFFGTQPSLWSNSYIHKTTTTVCVCIKHLYMLHVYGEKVLKHSKRRVLLGSRCRLHGYMLFLQLSGKLRQVFPCRR